MAFEMDAETHNEPLERRIVLLSQRKVALNKLTF